MKKIAIDIKSQSPVVTKAKLLNEYTVSISFDVNINGPDECHPTEKSDTKACCDELFLRDEFLSRGIRKMLKILESIILTDQLN